jgi:hypothetical protein
VQRLFCSAPLLRAPIDTTVVIHGQLTTCARGAGLPFVFLPRTAPQVQWALDGRRWTDRLTEPEERESHSPQATGQGPRQAPPVPADTAGQRLARTHACLTPATACMGYISMDASDLRGLRRDLLLREPTERESEKGGQPQPARTSASCMDHRLLLAGRGSLRPPRRSRSIAPKPSRASRKACIAACGRSLIPTPSIRCSRFLYGRRCVLASALPLRNQDAGGRSGGPLAAPCGPARLPSPCVRGTLRANLAGQGAAVSCAACSTS